MESGAAGAKGSKRMLWTGRIVSALPCAMLLFSAAMKFIKPPQFEEGMTHLGWESRLGVPLGVLEVACTVVYLVPRTAVVGAILLTGYLGGATATHVRVGDNFIGPVAFGVLVWLGLYLRDARVRALVPLRRPA